MKFRYRLLFICFFLIGSKENIDLEVYKINEGKLIELLSLKTSIFFIGFYQKRDLIPKYINFMN